MEGRAWSLQPIEYPLDKLKKATNNFSNENRLGNGGSGVIYKGKVNGTMVAIKKLHDHFSSVERLVDVAKEVSLLCSLRHDSLVKLLGFCSEARHYLLVYEYIQNGDLSGYLNDESKRKELTWEKRFNIVKGIAEGLVYLHDLEDPIIHRDLKPANVLLNENHNAKIADFGLSKIFDKNKTHISTRRGCGTPGYLAPELWYVQQYSPKSDVYNFGQLILEIIAGCTIPQYAGRNEGEVLQHDVWRKWKKKSHFKCVIDPLIRDKSQKDHIERCIQIGLLCIQNNRYDRPDMKGVLRMLNTNISLSAPDYPGFLQEESRSRVESQPTEDESTRTKLVSRGHRVEFQLIEHADAAPMDPIHTKQYSLQDIKIATNKFSMELSHGGLWNSYKGELDGQEVVVEKIHDIGRREKLLKIISFVKEGSGRDILLPNTRHPIVNILGYCLDDQENKLYSVFEYPRKGLLSAYLYDDDCPNRKWSTYKRIIRGIATAVCYLHHGSRQKYLVHGFLHPLNIWLDESRNVQLSFLPCTDVKDRDERFSEIRLPCGRLGFVTRDNRISADVYGFGATLLHILLGNKIFEDASVKRLSYIDIVEELLNKAWNHWDNKKDMLELVDARIRNYRSKRVLCYFEIALLCVQPEPELRPNMVEVVKMLNRHVALPIRSCKHRRSY